MMFGGASDKLMALTINSATRRQKCSDHEMSARHISSVNVVRLRGPDIKATSTFGKPPTIPPIRNPLKDLISSQGKKCVSPSLPLLLLSRQL
jgi:hypothetical protein